MGRAIMGARPQPGRRIGWLTRDRQWRVPDPELFVGLFIAAEQEGLVVLPATHLLAVAALKIIECQQPDVDSTVGQSDEFGVEIVELDRARDP